MNRGLGLFAVLGVLLVGCRSGEQVAQKSQVPDSAPPVSAPEKQDTSSVPGEPDSGASQTESNTDRTKRVAEKALGEPLPDPRVGGPERTTAAPSSQGWRRSKLTAAQIASAMDRRLASLSKSHAELRIFLDTPDGGRGSSELDAYFKDKNTFYVEAVGFEPAVVGREVYQTRIVANGAYVTELQGDGSWSHPVPVSKRKGAVNLLAEWPKKYPTLIFDGVGNGGNTFSRLVKDAMKPSSGMDVVAEERSAVAQGKAHVTRRILITRKAAVAKKKGELTVELIAGASYLPLTGRASFSPPGGKPVNTLWTAYWKQGDMVEIPAEKFRLPVAVPGRKS